MHYSLGVFVPKDITEDSEVKSYIEKLMAPYCEEINGKRNRRKGRWDFYRVGGRWDGEIQDKPNMTSWGNFEDGHEIVANNIMSASEVKPDLFYSLLTPNGKWFGTWRDELTDETRARLFKKYQDHNIVMVDYHN